MAGRARIFVCIALLMQLACAGAEQPASIDSGNVDAALSDSIIDLSTEVDGSVDTLADAPSEAVDQFIAIDQLAPDQLISDSSSDSIIEESVIYVATIGTDTATCGDKKDNPCQSISKGMQRASLYMPPRTVHIAGGDYKETLDLVDGSHLSGGFDETFTKGGPGNTTVLIKGVIDLGKGGGQAVAIRAQNLLLETFLEDLVIESPDATESGISSYALYVDNAPHLSLVRCTIKAGNGADGVDGVGTDVPAPSGNDGNDGFDGNNFAFEPLPGLCPTPQADQAGDRGLGAEAVSKQGIVCKGAGGNGGYAGADKCDGASGSAGTGALIGTVSSCGPSDYGKGGQGGGGHVQANCNTNKVATAGADGCDGKSGTSGTHGKGGNGGGLVGTFWFGEDGIDGSTAINDSSGGGGGGGGGGGDCDFFNCGCFADWGGGGAGGGSAGCAGSAGSAGTAGGGSFAIFLVSSAASIMIDDCIISTGNGGKGGDGGNGQPGGKGGSAGKGAKAFQDSAAGGDGGKGGDGGDGGHGGGGSGGPTVGIFVGQGSTPKITKTTYLLGSSGKGGKSAQNAGADGAEMDIGP
jgi:hypothetical protein